MSDNAIAFHPVAWRGQYEFKYEDGHSNAKQLADHVAEMGRKGWMVAHIMNARFHGDTMSIMFQRPNLEKPEREKD